MKVFDLKDVKHEKAGVIAFGFFDCIHRGHRKVIEKAVELSRENGLPSSVFLFKNNIFPLLGVEKHPIFDFEERLSLIRELGVDCVFYIEADRAFLSLSASSFLGYLKEKLEIAGFVCGADFSFGDRGIGRPEDLIREIGGISCVLDLYEDNGRKISTEAVKKALSEGDISLAERLLGRRLTLRRQVESGRRDGREMGYPTINFSLGTLPLKSGVYFTKVTVHGASYSALTNVGAHPTFGDYRENIETFLLDFKGDLYGKEVELEFLKYHRGILRFDAVDDLKKQIAADVSARREYD